MPAGNGYSLANYSNPNTGYNGSRFRNRTSNMDSGNGPDSGIGLNSNWGDLGSLGKFSVGMQGLTSLAGLWQGMQAMKEQKRMNDYNIKSGTLDADNRALIIGDQQVKGAGIGNQMNGLAYGSAGYNEAMDKVQRVQGMTPTAQV
jgi:hypothetical protein